LTKICIECKQEKSTYDFYTRKNNNKTNIVYYNSKCIDCSRKRVNNWKNQNKKKIHDYNVKYSKKWREENKELKKQLDKEYRQKNKERINEYQINKKQIDINYRIKCNLRNRIYNVLKRKQKASSLMVILGCTIEELRIYLESLFQDGMTWQNYGKWHIDHIIPCASFDLSKVEDQQKCFNYKNLQPLWALDNLKKSNKII
jgi:hypothetical protein